MKKQTVISIANALKQARDNILEEAQAVAEDNPKEAKIINPNYWANYGIETAAKCIANVLAPTFDRDTFLEEAIPRRPRPLRSYMPDTIDLSPNDPTTCGAYFGPLAHRFFTSPRLRKRIEELVEAARCSSNRHFVLDKDGETKAAQSTRLNALDYMNDGRVLVSIHL